MPAPASSPGSRSMSGGHDIGVLPWSDEYGSEREGVRPGPSPLGRHRALRGGHSDQPAPTRRRWRASGPRPERRRATAVRPSRSGRHRRRRRRRARPARRHRHVSRSTNRATCVTARPRRRQFVGDRFCLGPADDGPVRDGAARRTGGCRAATWATSPSARRRRSESAPEGRAPVPRAGESAARARTGLDPAALALERVRGQSESTASGADHWGEVDVDPVHPELSQRSERVKRVGDLVVGVTQRRDRADGQAAAASVRGECLSRPNLDDDGWTVGERRYAGRRRIAPCGGDGRPSSAGWLPERLRSSRRSGSRCTGVAAGAV